MSSLEMIASHAYYLWHKPLDFYKTYFSLAEIKTNVPQLLAPRLFPLVESTCRIAHTRSF
jgi:hypothetical protein